MTALAAHEPKPYHEDGDGAAGDRSEDDLPDHPTLDAEPRYPIPNDRVEAFVNYTRFEATKKVKAQMMAIESAGTWSYEMKHFQCQRPGEPDSRPSGEQWYVPRHETITSCLEAQQARAARRMEEFDEERQRLHDGVAKKQDGSWHIPRGPLREEGSLEWQAHHIAERAAELVEEATLNMSQRHIAALGVDVLIRRLMGDIEAVLQLIVVGSGGTGKTWTQNEVLRPLVQEILGHGAERGLCMSNSACRVLGKGAMTIHKAMHAKKGQKLTAADIRVKSQEVAAAQWSNVLMTVIDEFGMLGAMVLHALMEYVSLGREGVDGYERAKYLEEPLGRMCLLILQGDFMQLDAVMAQGVIDFHKDAAALLFRRLPHMCVVLGCGLQKLCRMLCVLYCVFSCGLRLRYMGALRYAFAGRHRSIRPASIHELFRDQCLMALRQRYRAHIQ